jgi:hypothetical protein
VCLCAAQAMYPVLASHYLKTFLSDSASASGLVSCSGTGSVSAAADTTGGDSANSVLPVPYRCYATGIVVVMTLVKLMGREVLEKMSTVLALLALTPSVIYVYACQPITRHSLASLPATHARTLAATTDRLQTEQVVPPVPPPPCLHPVCTLSAPCLHPVCAPPAPCVRACVRACVLSLSPPRATGVCCSLAPPCSPVQVCRGPRARLLVPRRLPRQLDRPDLLQHHHGGCVRADQERVRARRLELRRRAGDGSPLLQLGPARGQVQGRGLRAADFVRRCMPSLPGSPRAMMTEPLDGWRVTPLPPLAQ